MTEGTLVSIIASVIKSSNFDFMSNDHLLDLQINEQKVVSETVGQEAIAIDLETGTYYSFNDSASFLWDKLSQQVGMKNTIEAFVSRYEGDREDLEKAVRAFFDELSRLRLVIPAGEFDNEPLREEAAEKKPFVPPKFETYYDMQEMLLADPIHDVDDTGWPKLKDARHEN